MIKNTYQCDICGKERGPSNHWRMACNAFGYTDGPPGLGFFSWDATVADREGVAHLCSSDCAHKLLERFLEDRKKASA